ncbi:MAG TPA: hypothetical protein PKC18_16100 [Lacipirellulaceae bacterium]|nr:hypothetical protein [Lacipirellulaceae bacterium]
MTQPLWYPPEAVAPYCDREQLQDLIAANNRHLDVAAAELVETVANYHHTAWADKRSAIKLRRMLRLAAAHLRSRRNG